MARIEVFEQRPAVLGINSLGRIGKLTLWHHVGRKYFREIVVNQGREVGTGLHAIAQLIEKDATYGLLHRFLHGVRAERVIEIVDEKKGKLLVDGIPVTILRESRNPNAIPWRDYGVDVVAECTGKFGDPTVPAEDAKGSIQGHLAGGAKVVINSSAFKIKNKALAMPDDAVTVIYGINHPAFDVRETPARFRRFLHDDGPCAHGEAPPGERRNEYGTHRFHVDGARGDQFPGGARFRSQGRGEGFEKEQEHPEQHHSYVDQCSRSARAGDTPGKEHRFHGRFHPGAHQYGVAHRPQRYLPGGLERQRLYAHQYEGDQRHIQDKGG